MTPQILAYLSTFGILISALIFALWGKKAISNSRQQLELQTKKMIGQAKAFEEWKVTYMHKMCEIQCENLDVKSDNKRLLTVLRKQSLALKEAYSEIGALRYQRGQVMPGVEIPPNGWDSIGNLGLSRADEYIDPGNDKAPGGA